MRHLWLLLLFNFTNSLFFFGQQTANTENRPLVHLNSPLSYRMLEQNQDLRKINVLLDARRDDAVHAPGLMIGTSLVSIFDYQVSNIESKFAYLMRIPTAKNQIGKEVSEVVIHSFQFAVTGSVYRWLAAHAEMLYSPQQSFGEGTITALGRNQLQLRTGYVLIGDLDKFPLYAALGKLDAAFGQTGSVSPFTNSTLWHAFGGLCYGLQVGYIKGEVEATLTAVQGGAQFRALNTPVGDATNVPSRINNFTVDINYTLDYSPELRIQVGGSYMHGSAYNQEFPVLHFAPGLDNNPAYTFYGNLTWLDRLYLKGGYAQTLDEWPGTHNPTPPLDIFDAAKVSSLDVGFRYDLKRQKEMQYSISGEFSNFRAGADNSPWERQNQIVLGFAGQYKGASKLFIELFRTDGYAPLNFISGGNVEPGETHSVRDAHSHGIVIGGNITL